MHIFDHPNADVILRSSDKEPVDFRVFKLLLSLASPFFSELFSLPQSSIPSVSDESRDPGGLPIIQMTEDRETLRLLLSLCFPLSISKIPHFSSLQEIQKVIEAAFKFEMAGLQMYLRTELIALRFIEAQPLRVFAIAYRYGWDKEARMAARYTLRHHMNPAFFLELGYISGATYYRLQEYHRMCGEVASSRVTLQPALAEYDDNWTWITCQRCPGTMTSRDSPDVRSWWERWIHKVAEEVRVRPWGDAVKKWDILKDALRQAEACPNCAERAREDLEAFSLMLAVEIEKDISLVRFLEILHHISRVIFNLYNYNRLTLISILMIGVIFRVLLDQEKYNA